MGHSIYTGSFAALEKRWIEIVTELRREDPLLEINVLVGSNILATYLKRRFVRTGNAMANVRFHTFPDLARQVVSDAVSAPEKPRIPDLGTSIILEEILATQTPAVFNPLSEFTGFRDALLDTFRDLRDAEVTPEEFQRALDSNPYMNNRREHLEALALLYRRYRERVLVFQDVDDDFRTAISAVSRAIPKQGVRQLMVYGVYDVTGQQSRFLAALKDAVDMAYFIPYVNETVSGFARSFLQARTLELGVDVIPLPESSPKSSLGSLSVRGFGFLSTTEARRREALAPDGSYTLVSVPGESRSAVEIVREIIRAVQEGTIHGFQESAVILRQPETDIPVLAEMLRLRHIPYFIHGGCQYADRLLPRSVVAIVDLATNAFSRESTLSAMELVAASMPETDASFWDVQSWRAITNHSRFLSGIRSWDVGVDALVHRAQKNLQKSDTRNAPYADEEVAEAAARQLDAALSLQNGWRLLRKAVGNWPKELSWKEWADFLYRRMEPLLGASEDWDLFSSVLDKIGNLSALNASRIRDTSHTREVTEKTPRNRLISSDTLKASLIRSIRALSCPVGRFQRSGVNILSTSAARGLRFPLVIIPGLDEGRFPAKLRQDPLLLDAERESMERLPLKKKRLDEERLLFDMAARSAEKRLVLMTSRLEESSDRERIPSQFFLRAASAARGDDVAMRDLNPDIVPGFRSVGLDNPAPLQDEVAVDEGEVRLRLIVSGKYPAQVALAALAQLEPIRFSRPLAYDRERWVHDLTPYDGLIRDPGLVQWMTGTIRSQEDQVSASRLEAYAKCPYFYFLRYGLKLEAWEESAPVESINPLERGLAVHSILEGFLKENIGDALLRTPDSDLRNSLESLAKGILEQYRPAGIADLLWEIECDALLEMLRNWLMFEKKRAQEGLLPAQLELIFGKFPQEEQFPVYRVEAGRHRFDFRGRIDRVDVSADGLQARVVDYKTGMLPDSMAGKSRTSLMGGERIQLAVYAGALSILNVFQSVQSVAGEYLHLQPRDARIRPCAFTGEELDRASAQLRDILEILGDGMESGVFFPRTSGMLHPSGHCDYCEYLMICGKDRNRREELKAADPHVRNFMRIVEYV